MSRASIRRNYKTFVIVLAATCLVWLVATMSDVRDYDYAFDVEYVGYDTARYALVEASPTVTLTIASNGFRAIRNSVVFRNGSLRVSLASAASRVTKMEESYTFDLRMSRFVDDFERQVDLPNSSRITPRTETLRVRMAQRRRKPFVPQLRNIDISFAAGCGICGDARIEPDTVWLYGSAASLDGIESVYTAPATVANIDRSGYVTLDLDPVWEKYADLRSSTSSVRVYIPVEAYTEGTVTLPVRFLADDTSLRAKLYPEQVEVTYWVPIKEAGNVSLGRFVASVDYSATDNTEMRVCIDQFPSNVRIKSIQPEYVKYVIIK